MAEPDITVAVPKPLDLGRQDVVFAVNIDGKKARELHVSRRSRLVGPRGKDDEVRQDVEQLQAFMES